MKPYRSPWKKVRVLYRLVFGGKKNTPLLERIVENFMLAGFPLTAGFLAMLILTVLVLIERFTK